MVNPLSSPQSHETKQSKPATRKKVETKDHFTDISHEDPLEAEAVGSPGRAQAGLQESQKMKETRVHLP